jgi:primosomal protein N' (replication factor Y)
MTKQSLCKVALPLPLKTFFTYALPGNLSSISAGTRVLVPFGKRTLVGYTVEEGGEDLQNIKQISSVLDESPFFSAELFSFLKELAKYYLAPLGIILKNSYPSGLDPQLKKRYSLISDQEREIKDPILLKLIEELKDGSKSYSTLKTKFGKETDKIITKGLSWGIIESLEYFEMVRRRINLDRIAVLKDFEEIEKDAEAKGLTKYHLKIIEAIKKSNEAFPKAVEIAKAAKSPHHYIQDLEKIGFIELFDMLPKKLPIKPSNIVLNNDQSEAFEKISLSLDKNEHRTFLIFGITGSGKTEIYLNLIEKVINKGGRAIYLVPEISLASYLSKRLLERFGSNVSILHSSLTEKERVRQYLRMKKGDAKVVIGPRSALFAPLENIKLIVVDEEHDPSYRQVEHPFYNARDMAILRSSLLKCPIVMGSATPSVESFYNAVETKKFELLVLKERVKGATLPEVEVVDMRKVYSETKKKSVLSPLLEEEIKKAIEKKEQTVILRNRLGYSTFILCRECGRTIKCSSCDISLTHHKKRNELKCHICGKKENIPQKCPNCSSESLHFLGEGTEKIEDLLTLKFPQCKIGRMDRDVIVSSKDYEKLWNDFENKKIDILVGTQMIAKGYHNPQVTLVGIISADFILSLPDFRSSERTFQLITQAAGRSGRGELKGKVVIQSYFPEHYAVISACRQDYEQFYSSEIKYRKMAGYPPVIALGRIEIKDKKEEKAIEKANFIKDYLKSKWSQNCRILGPNPAPIAKIENRFRYQIFVKTPTRTLLHKIFEDFINSDFSKEISRTIFADVDPATLM